MKFLSKMWEMFYTDAKNQNQEEGLVDQISIDTVNKTYILDEEALDMNTDGWDEEGNEINSVYVSREIYDIILQGLKLKGYKQVKFEK